MSEFEDEEIEDPLDRDPLDVLTEARTVGKRVAVEKLRTRPEGWKPPGRKTKLTVPLRNAIVATILEGTPQGHAAVANGVAVSTYHSWKQRGETARTLAENGEDVPAADKPYLDFLEATEAARAELLTRLTGSLQRAALGAEVAEVIESYDEDSGKHLRTIRYHRPSVRALTFFVERGWPQDFSRRLEVAGPEGKAIPVEVEVSARDRIKRKLADMAEREGGDSTGVEPSG